MNIKDIKVGKKYSDGKGAVREVVAEGPQYKHYDHSMITDNIRVRVVKRGPKDIDSSALKVGDERNIPRASFANWAKFETN